MTTIYPHDDTYTSKLAVAIDLSTTDWTSAANNIITTTPVPARQLYLGGTGDLTVVLAGDPATQITFKSHPAGYTEELAVIKVIKATTTATNLVALY